MIPEEIAEVRPRLLDFTAEMLGGLARKDQRAAGELYVRGLLTDGQRKSMVPMAERAGHRSSAAAAVHHVLDLGLRSGAAECGARCPSPRGPDARNRYMREWSSPIALPVPVKTRSASPSRDGEADRVHQLSVFTGALQRDLEKR
jgi:hypothetical protein